MFSTLDTLTNSADGGGGTGDNTNRSSDNGIGGLCFHESQTTLLYHVSSVCFLLSYCAPNTRYGQVLLHTGLIVGYLLSSTWAWNVVCAPDVFAWYFAFMMLNMGQLLYILYQLRPVRFDDDLDRVYTGLFEPMQVSRVQFRRLVGAESAEIISLHPGECYAVENMTRTDRLSLLLTGKVNVLSERSSFLHHVGPHQFLDSPEFESCSNEETFRVSICAAVPSRYITWQRASLEYLFVKETYLAQVITALISHDITEKLYAMNARLRSDGFGGLGSVGCNVDIRLPAIAGRLCNMDTRDHALYKTNNGN